MKTLNNYGNNIEQYCPAVDKEFYTTSDSVSARDLNRPIINLSDNQDSIYELLSTLLKQTYGNVDMGIVPFISEEFTPETMIVGGFLGNSNGKFIRIPNGMMFLKRDINEEKGADNHNPFSVLGEHNYKENLNKDIFLQDRFKSFIIENKPEISLAERQLASMAGIDLTDLTNDIKIYHDLIPICYKLNLVDEFEVQIVKHDGSLSFAENEESNCLFLADLSVEKNEGQKYYKISDVIAKKTIIDVPRVNSETERYKDTISVYYKKVDETTGKIEIPAPMTLEQAKNITLGNNEYIFVDSMTYALTRKDSSGNVKYQDGYYAEIHRVTTKEDEIVNIPNKRQNAKWDILFDIASGYEDVKGNKIVLEVKDQNGIAIENISFNITADITNRETLNTKIYQKLFSEATYLDAERFTTKSNKNGISIILKNSALVCNQYTFSAYYIVDETQSFPLKNIFVDELFENNDVVDLSVGNKIEQKYFTNIFELTNSFIGHYQGYMTNVSDIYSYLNFENYFNLSCYEGINDFNIYYDLNSDYTNNGNLDNYTKDGRFCIYPKTNNVDDNLIKLYSISIDTSVKTPYQGIIKNITSFIPTLDARTIATKRAELDSLSASTRTELFNWLKFNDNENRSIEAAEEGINLDKSKNSKKNQLRIKSPILRLTNKDTLSEGSENPIYNSWADNSSGKGDVKSDFETISYQVRNFNNDTTKYYAHLDNNNLGLIIDENNGLKIFNSSTDQKSSRFSYSPWLPIEIVNEKGNVNLFTNNNGSKINISNLKDDDTNVIDLKGLSRIRSKNNNEQLTIRKIAATENISNLAGINFAIGESTAKQDYNVENAYENSDLNVIAGSINFGSGDLSNRFNSNPNNRFMQINLATTNENKNFNNVLAARNNVQNSIRHTITVYGDLVPTENSNNNLFGILGAPINSRTYKTDSVPNSSTHIQYTRDVDNNQIPTTDSGSSTEYIGNENRWLASFIKYGYFKKITLADRAEDVNNQDSRDGALRLGNSNIYDVSSIYINNESGSSNNSTLNFDNQETKDDVFTENTIYSHYSDTDNDSKNGFKFILKRLLGSNTYDNKNELAENYVAAEFTPEGNIFNKNTYINRQLWVNVQSDPSNESSNFDNSSLVVNGQSILNGELVVGKNAENTVDVKNSETVEVNYSSAYKKYNTEYFPSNNKEIKDNDKQNSSIKDALFISRTYGRSLFDGDITLSEDKKFTENTTFNKSVVINNNNYNSETYNSMSLKVPEDDNRYISSSELLKNKYYTKSSAVSGKSGNQLPRHHSSLKVVSGLVEIGNYSNNSEFIDYADLRLNGSQWIKRRLAISSSDNFKDTYAFNNKLGDTKYSLSDSENASLFDKQTFTSTPDEIEIFDEQYVSKVSPSFYVEKASQFDGDVVFGGGLVSQELDINSNVNEPQELIPDANKVSTTSWLMASHINKDTSVNNGVKTIFWGKNKKLTKKVENDKNVVKNYNTDFDFHGRTLFDGDVYFGLNADYGTTFPRINQEPTLNIYGQLNQYSTENTTNFTSKSLTFTGTETVDNGATLVRLVLNEQNGDGSTTGQASLLSSGSFKVQSQVSSKSGFINEITLNNNGAYISEQENLNAYVGKSLVLAACKMVNEDDGYNFSSDDENYIAIYSDDATAKDENNQEIKLGPSINLKTVGSIVGLADDSIVLQNKDVGVETTSTKESTLALQNTGAERNIVAQTTNKVIISSFTKSANFDNEITTTSVANSTYDKNGTVNTNASSTIKSVAGNNNYYASLELKKDGNDGNATLSSSRNITLNSENITVKNSENIFKLEKSNTVSKTSLEAKNISLKSTNSFTQEANNGFDINVKNSNADLFKIYKTNNSGSDGLKVDLYSGSSVKNTMFMSGSNTVFTCLESSNDIKAQDICVKNIRAYSSYKNAAGTGSRVSTDPIAKFDTGKLTVTTGDSSIVQQNDDTTISKGSNDFVKIEKNKVTITGNSVSNTFGSSVSLLSGVLTVNSGNVSISKDLRINKITYNGGSAECIINLAKENIDIGLSNSKLTFAKNKDAEFTGSVNFPGGATFKSTSNPLAITNSCMTINGWAVSIE